MNDYFKSRLKVLKYQSSLFQMFGYNVQKKTTVYTCPCCNEFKSGIIYANKKKTFPHFALTCRNCKKTLDIINLYMVLNDIKDHKKAMTDLLKIIEENNFDEDKLEIVTDSKTGRKNIKIDIEDITEEEKDIYNIKNGTYIEYFKTCRDNLKDNFDTSYMISRGFKAEDKEKIYKLGIGLDPEDNSIVFPITKYTYIKRLTRTYKSKKGTEIRYNNSKKIHQDSHYCFNLHKLKDYNIIYLFEGVFDCLTMQVINPDYLSIATGGASNLMALEDELTEYANDNNKYLILICFDSDSAGENGTKKLIDNLSNNKNIFIQDIKKLLIDNFITNKSEEINKDLNDIFKRDREELEKQVEFYNNFANNFLKYKYKEN